MMKSGAKSIKETIKKAVFHENLKPHSTEKSPFHHPIAKQFKEGKIALSPLQQALVEQCQRSAKLIITEEDLQILLAFFEERKNSEDKLGKLYQTLSFTDFVLRLFHKRFKEVYFDGRAVVLRDGSSHGGSGTDGKAFLSKIGTDLDKEDLYKEYLTLEEAVLSTLVLPQAVSIVIGTGSREAEQNWDIKKEFNESIDIAVFSYPAAAEFRNARTAHYDLLFIARPKVPSSAYLQQIEAIKNNQALMNAARKIYGPTFAFEEAAPTEFVTMNQGDASWDILISAYLARTTKTLKMILLASDHQLKESGLGNILQLKGLGLGAFSFSGSENTARLEALYLQALRNLIHSPEFKLQYIDCINIINLPSDFNDKRLVDGGVVFSDYDDISSKFLISHSIMAPSSKLRQRLIGEIGAIVVCGDSGSKFGNEGNIGLHRDSSDDPAAQYSLLDPLILDPDINPTLKNKNCIYIVNAQGLEQYHEGPKKLNDLANLYVARTQLSNQAPTLTKGYYTYFALVSALLLVVDMSFIGMFPALTASLIGALGITLSPLMMSLTSIAIATSLLTLVALSFDLIVLKPYWKQHQKNQMQKQHGQIEQEKNQAIALATKLDETQDKPLINALTQMFDKHEKGKTQNNTNAIFDLSADNTRKIMQFQIKKLSKLQAKPLAQKAQYQQKIIGKSKLKIN